MNGWRWLVGFISAVQLWWGLSALVEFSRSVSTLADPTEGLVFTALGAASLAVLGLPRLGIPVAVVQGLVAAYALCWLPFALVCLRMPVGPLLPFPWALPFPLGQPAIALLILGLAGATAALCLLNALGTWQVARRAQRLA